MGNNGQPSSVLTQPQQSLVSSSSTSQAPAPVATAPPTPTNVNGVQNLKDRRRKFATFVAGNEYFRAPFEAGGGNALERDLDEAEQKGNKNLFETTAKNIKNRFGKYLPPGFEI